MMQNDLKTVNTATQEEFEKQVFGQDMYKYSYKLPLIVVNNDAKDSYYRPSVANYIELIKDIFDLSGQELSLLFAEIYKIYKMEEEENNHNKFISHQCTTAIGQISLALKQSTILLDKLQDDDKTLIKGDEYCFIALCLNQMLVWYTFMFDTIMTKRYPCEESLEKMNRILSLVLSAEFQLFRKIFKGVECNEQVKFSETIH